MFIKTFILNKKNEWVLQVCVRELKLILKLLGLRNLFVTLKRNMYDKKKQIDFKIIY